VWQSIKTLELTCNQHGATQHTGATQHMTSHRELFSEFVSCDRTLSYADDRVPSIEGCGSVNVGFAGKDFVLKNVLFVPSLGRNLFSITAAIGHGGSIQFSMESCRFSYSCGYHFQLTRSKSRFGLMS
jgi:hypothetical protein